MEKINNNFEIQHLAENLFLNLNLADNPNAQNEDGDTPIYCAAKNGQTEIVKILAPLTDNPNAPDRFGWTPIHEAEINGHIEIVNILKSYKKSAKRSTIFEPSFTQSTKRPRKPFNYQLKINKN